MEKCAPLTSVQANYCGSMIFPLRGLPLLPFTNGMESNTWSLHVAVENWEPGQVIPLWHLPYQRNNLLPAFHEGRNIDGFDFRCHGTIFFCMGRKTYGVVFE